MTILCYDPLINTNEEPIDLLSYLPRLPYMSLRHTQVSFHDLGGNRTLHLYLEPLKTLIRLKIYLARLS